MTRRPTSMAPKTSRWLPKPRQPQGRSSTSGLANGSSGRGIIRGIRPVVEEFSLLSGTPKNAPEKRASAEVRPAGILRSPGVWDRKPHCYRSAIWAVPGRHFMRAHQFSLLRSAPPIARGRDRVILPLGCNEPWLSHILHPTASNMWKVIFLTRKGPSLSQRCRSVVEIAGMYSYEEGPVEPRCLPMRGDDCRSLASSGMPKTITRPQHPSIS
jgi:hypothetical protein